MNHEHETKPHHNESTLTPSEQADHARSVKDYPQLDLNGDEYVVIDLARQPLARAFIWVVAIVAAILLVVCAIWFANMESTVIHIDKGLVYLIGVGLAVFALLCGGIANSVWKQNYLVVSNQRVFLRHQITPFSHYVQTVEIENIEDTSYSQNGVIQMILGYGTVRMSTIGDEHTYELTFVKNPAEQMKVVKKVVNAVDKVQPTAYRKPE